MRHPGGCKSGITGFYQTNGMKRYRCNLCDFDLCERCLISNQPKKFTSTYWASITPNQDENSKSDDEVKPDVEVKSDDEVKLDDEVKPDDKIKSDNPIADNSDLAVNNSGIECSICMSAKKDAVFVECGHMMCCFDCGKTLNSKCPICRKTGKIIKIYNC